jgi:hypothetical protein
MKKYLLLSCTLVCIAHAVMSQAINYYKDSFYTQAYSRLGSNATSITNGQYWDTLEYNAPIGFNFKLFADSTFTIGCNKFFNPGAFFATKPFSIFTPNYTVLCPYSSTLADRGYSDSTGNVNLSPISYITTGAAPNRIFKLEYRNVTFAFSKANNFINDSLDFQMWLYEGSNVVEVHFGPRNIQAPNADIHDNGNGPGIFIIKNISAVDFDIEKSYCFINDPAQPELDSIGPAAPFTSLQGLDNNPAPNTVYRIQPIKPIVFPASIAHPSKSIITLTNTSNTLYVRNNIDAVLQAQVYNTNGCIVAKTLLTGTLSPVDITNWPSGVYVLRVGNTSYKWVK